MKINTSSIAGIGALVGVAVLGYVVWKILDKLGETKDKVGDAIGDALAPWFVGEHAQVEASVMLPSGQTISFNQVVAEGGKLEYKGNEQYVFTYRGVTYRVVPPRRTDGVYVATRA